MINGKWIVLNAKNKKFKNYYLRKKKFMLKMNKHCIQKMFSTDFTPWNIYYNGINLTIYFPFPSAFLVSLTSMVVNARGFLSFSNIRAFPHMHSNYWEKSVLGWIQQPPCYIRQEIFEMNRKESIKAGR